MAKSPVEVWLWLLLVMQPFNKKTNFILDECGGDASQAGRNIRDGKYDFLSDAEKKNAERVRIKDVRELMAICEKNRVRVITLDDEEYPSLLRGIENPPIVLFCAGSLAGLDGSITLSAVGARNVSPYGINVAHRIIEPLAKLGITIVSGMAVGSDAEAHKACLAAGGRTIGVLGCGILVNYPAENAGLKRNIIANGGAIISELLPHTKTFGAYFPIRNRIISGISMGTLVIEAGEKSGSLLTARHAAEQNRDVFCIPPQDLFSTRYNGVVPLLREGAVPVYNFTDILNEYSMYFSNEKYIKDYVAQIEKTVHDRKKPGKPKSPVKSKEHEEPTEGSKSDSVESKPTEKDLSALQPDEAKAVKLIADGVSTVNKLVENSGIEYDALTEILTNLELEGYIQRNRDGSFSVV